MISDHSWQFGSSLGLPVFDSPIDSRNSESLRHVVTGVRRRVACYIRVTFRHIGVRVQFRECVKRCELKFGHNMKLRDGAARSASAVNKANNFIAGFDLINSLIQLFDEI